MEFTSKPHQLLIMMLLMSRGRGRIRVETMDAKRRLKKWWMNCGRLTLTKTWFQLIQTFEIYNTVGQPTQMEGSVIFQRNMEYAGMSQNHKGVYCNLLILY
ncbi:hypothetical protein L6164_005579 [Bauhinia variegata]|uniref:Uncharacterized protein n=1 Tax=Bauhinia variegata TaxID=167791 RepID=A0ACB9PX58_BAUVA|nr:hypothetical protein L6164_005579 [Bauhinia variegata]